MELTTVNVLTSTWLIYKRPTGLEPQEELGSREVELKSESEKDLKTISALATNLPFLLHTDLLY